MHYAIALCALTMLGWSSLVRADWTEARCDIYPTGQDHPDQMIACTFAQRQGAVSISRSDGITHELTPNAETPGNYLDQHDEPVYRQSGLGPDGLIFRFPTQSVYVYWDTAALTGDRHDIPLTANSWQLVKIMSMDDSVFEPANTALYTLTFSSDGAVAVQADCNRASGDWSSTRRGHLEFGPLATTRALCAPGSLSEKYLGQLSFVRSYVMRDGHLFLATMADGAIIEFEPRATGP